ncbi:MAG: hypothetical protein ACRDEA_02415 [Microcystaceae cyanobacterium]
MYSNDPFERDAPVNRDFGNFAEDLWPIQDADGDGLSNQTEAFLGTDPYSVDTDRDGLSDSQELALGTNPLFPDTDRDGINDGADLWHGAEPKALSPLEAPEASQYKRFSQEIDSGLSPFLQAKQVAQAALKEDFTTSEVRNILSESPRFKEIDATLGAEQAEQLATLAIAAAQRQNALDFLVQQPQLQTEYQQAHQENKQIKPAL